MTSFDKLTIETPEQTALELPLAGIGSRFLALGVDYLIQFIAFMALLILYTNIIIPWPWLAQWAEVIFIFVFFFLSQAYFAFFEAFWNGQSPGKRYTRLRVIKEDGRPVGVADAVARNLLRIVDWLPGIYVVGIVTMMLNRQNKRLGDYVAGTVVVHEKPFEEMQLAWDLAERPGAPLFHASRLSPEEFSLVETFLQRRSHLSDDVRRDMARQIADRVAEKLGTPPAPRAVPEVFLEGLARERRGAHRR
ncbi:MAG: RDD family protein [Candidatus Acidiferrales bacterium]